MTAPVRIQRRRTKGWRMPERAIYVGRPTMWGNPFTAQSALDAGYHDGHAMAVAAFRGWLNGEDWGRPEGLTEQRRLAIRASLPWLRGHDLVCWCPLDRPCHADVLLEIANQ